MEHLYQIGGSGPAFTNWPSAMGTGGFRDATTGTGTMIGLGGSLLCIAASHVSGTATADTATWADATRDALGLVPGS